MGNTESEVEVKSWTVDTKTDVGTIVDLGTVCVEGVGGRQKMVKGFLEISDGVRGVFVKDDQRI